jgi:nicotinate-nucleotide adenylyltransferase
MRVAFFGGTFDPIHRGHLRLATAAADAYALDRVLFAPVGQQPLKSEPAVASFADRLAMVSLACAADPTQPAIDPRFAVSTVDAPRADGSANYTVETLSVLALEFPSASLFVLSGADSFLSLRRWRSPDRLLELAEWIVVSRPEFPLSEVQLAPLSLSAAQRTRVHLLDTVYEDVSATDLRRRLRAGDSCTGLLPSTVATYIETHHLYR